MPISKPVYCLLMALVVGLAILLTVILSTQQVGLLRLGPFDSYRCDTGLNQGSEATFRVLTQTNYLAETLANSLCQEPTIAEHYQHVEISWQPRDQLTARDLAERRFDLLWNRPRTLTGLLYEFDRYYTRLTDTPPYSVYWLSGVDTPALDPDYFADKRIGLLRESQSQSNFQLPMNQLSQAGIRLRDEQKVYYVTRRELYAAFMTGEVDLISGIKWIGGREVAANRRLLIARDLPTGSWFLASHLTDMQLRCDVLAALGSLQPLYAQINPEVQPEPVSCGS